MGNPERGFNPAAEPPKDQAAHDSIEKAVRSKKEEEAVAERNREYQAFIAKELAEEAEEEKNKAAETAAQIADMREMAAKADALRVKEIRKDIGAGEDLTKITPEDSAAFAKLGMLGDNMRVARSKEMDDSYVGPDGKKAMTPDEFRKFLQERNAELAQERENVKAAETAIQIADMKELAVKADARKADEIRVGINAGEDMTKLTEEDRAAFAKLGAPEMNYAMMNKRRIDDMRKQVDLMKDAIKKEYGVDMEMKSAKGLMGRLWGGIREVASPGLRKATAEYNAKLELLNRLVTQEEEDEAGKDYWAKRADRGVTRDRIKPDTPTGGPLGRG